MRRIILDTEGTGKPADGEDRIVEIGLVETWNWRPTGSVLQMWFNPEQESLPGALKIHGLTSAFLEDKPKFSECAPQILDFIGSDVVVAHAAHGDRARINAELARCGRDGLAAYQFRDSLKPLQRLRPEGPHKLHLLAEAIGLRKTERPFHGALEDAQLLSDVILFFEEKSPGFLESDPSCGLKSEAALAAERINSESRRANRIKPEERHLAGRVGRAAASARGLQELIETLQTQGLACTFSSDQGQGPDLLVSDGANTVSLGRIGQRCKLLTWIEAESDCPPRP